MSGQVPGGHVDFSTQGSHACGFPGHRPLLSPSFLQELGLPRSRRRLCLSQTSFQDLEPHTQGSQ